MLFRVFHHKRELEQDGIIKRKVYKQVPPKVEYSLTPLGKTVIPVLDALCDWGIQHHARQLYGLIPN